MVYGENLKSQRNSLSGDTLTFPNSVYVCTICVL